MQKPKFDHKRYIKILFRRVFYFARVNQPYLSGDLFADIVDYAPWRSPRGNLVNSLRALLLLESKSFVPRISHKKLANAKSIFIPSHELIEFLEVYGNQINAKILFCGNSDYNFISTPKLPASVSVCYLQNSAISDGKTFRTLPIGIENLALGRAGQKKYYKKVNEQEIFDRILIPPMSPTNKARYGALLWGKNNPEIADTFFELLPEEQYFALAAKYKFIFCSEGNGFENHRIWEALYLGGFPVLLRTEWSITLEYLNLPILFVENYEEITKKLLQDFYEVHKDYKPQDSEVLWKTFWTKEINGVTSPIR